MLKKIFLALALLGFASGTAHAQYTPPIKPPGLVYPGTAGSFLISSLLTNDVDVANSVWGVSNGFVFEGATANGFELLLQPADPTQDNTVTFANGSGTVMLSQLSTNAPDAANSVFGISNGLDFEGATADAFETTITPTDPTADRTITLPNASGTVGFLPSGSSALVGTTLATNDADVANSVWGGTNQFIFEGATADTFETILTPTDATADRTITLPDLSGTALLGGAANTTAATTSLTIDTGTDDSSFTQSANKFFFDADVDGDGDGSFEMTLNPNVFDPQIGFYGDNGFANFEGPTSPTWAWWLYDNSGGDSAEADFQLGSWGWYWEVDTAADTSEARFEGYPDGQVKLTAKDSDGFGYFTLGDSSSQLVFGQNAGAASWKHYNYLEIQTNDNGVIGGETDNSRLLVDNREIRLDADFDADGDGTVTLSANNSINQVVVGASSLTSPHTVTTDVSTTRFGQDDLAFADNVAETLFTFAIADTGLQMGRFRYFARFNSGGGTLVSNMNEVIFACVNEADAEVCDVNAVTTEASAVDGDSGVTMGCTAGISAGTNAVSIQLTCDTSDGSGGTIDWVLESESLTALTAVGS